jgi:hypothetical protein
MIQVADMFWFCFVQCHLQCKHFMLRSQCSFEDLTMYDHVSHPSHGDCRQRHFILQLPEDGWTTLNLFRKMLNLVRPFSTQKVDVFFSEFSPSTGLESRRGTFCDIHRVESSWVLFFCHLGSSWVISGHLGSQVHSCHNAIQLQMVYASGVLKLKVHRSEGEQCGSIIHGVHSLLCLMLPSASGKVARKCFQ